MPHAWRKPLSATALALSMTVATPASAATALPAPELAGGSLRLQPLTPGGGGRVSAGTLDLVFTIGQPLAGRSDEGGMQLRPGF